MLAFNENQSNGKESRSSKIVKITKGRAPTAKNKKNYITLQEGDRKLTKELKNETLNKSNIDEALLTLRKDILKNSKSYTNFKYDEKNGDLVSTKKKLFIPFNEKDSNIKINKIKLK